MAMEKAATMMAANASKLFLILCQKSAKPEQISCEKCFVFYRMYLVFTVARVHDDAVACKSHRAMNGHAEASEKDRSEAVPITTILAKEFMWIHPERSGDEHGMDGQGKEGVGDGKSHDKNVSRSEFALAKAHHKNHQDVCNHRNDDCKKFALT